MINPDEDSPLWDPDHPPIYCRPALNYPPLDSVTYRHQARNRRLGYALRASRWLRQTRIYSAGVTCAADHFGDAFEHFGPCPIHPASIICCHGGATEWINHSVTPNARIIASRTHAVYLEILRDIAPHEEITIDYGEQYTAIRLLRNARR